MYAILDVHQSWRETKPDVSGRRDATAFGVAVTAELAGGELRWSDLKKVIAALHEDDRPLAIALVALHVHAAGLRVPEEFDPLEYLDAEARPEIRRMIDLATNDTAARS